MVLINTNIELLNGETENEYLWRLGTLKSDGVIDLGWKEIADLINKNCKDETEYCTECAYRKRYAAAKQFYDEIFSKENYESSSNEETLRELQKLKMQLRDERTGFNAKLRNEARLEQDLDYLKDKLQEIGKVKFTTVATPKISASGKEMIVCLSDLHAGQTFDSNFGKYNTDILKERMNQYLNKVLEIAKLHSCDTVHILCLGDEISGMIHNTVRITNRENVIEQVKIVSELIASFCTELSNYFKYVYVATVAGNHSRIFQSKDESLKDENLDLLIGWIVKQITNHIENITILDNQIDSSIASIEVCGKTYLGVHGNCDSMNESSIGRLIMAVEKIPYAIIGGHNHYPAYKQCNGVHYIQSGSFASAGDDYTISKRLTGKANQTILVVNSDGIEAIHNVKLD